MATHPVTQRPEPFTIWALYDDGSLARISAPDLRIATQRLSESSFAPTATPTQLLAGNHGHIAVLSPAGNEAFVLDSNANVVDRLRFVNGSFVAVTARPMDSAFIFVGSDSIGTRFAIWRQGRQLLYQTAARRDSLDWKVYNAAALEGSQRVAVSYHGTNTSGADVFDLAASSATRCTMMPLYRGHGCLLGHGSVVVNGHAIAFASGMGSILLFNSGLHALGTVETGLPGHVMNIAWNPAGEEVAAVSPCGGSGGISVVSIPRATFMRATRPVTKFEDFESLESSRRMVSRLPRRPSAEPAPICGDRLAWSAGGSLVVAVNNPRAVGADRSELLVIASGLGSVTRSIPGKHRILDILVR